MTALHICQGGISNGDKDWLEKASGKTDEQDWTVPKKALIGDEVVFHVEENGLYATGIVLSVPKKSRTRINRYRARVGQIALLNSPLPIVLLKRQIPSFKWSNYPRGYTSPSPEIVSQLRALLSKRGYWPSFPDVDGSESVIEGRPKLRVHFVKERSSNLSRQKKQTVLAQSGCLACECCNFDFYDAYGDRGKDFCEVHHTTPLAKLTKATAVTLSDLVIVCSNCHRMLHRFEPLLTIEQLKKIVKLQSQVS
jgi:5-methylcytosine-specific restriction enzyme A